MQFCAVLKLTSREKNNIFDILAILKLLKYIFSVFLRYYPWKIVLQVSNSWNT